MLTLSAAGKSGIEAVNVIRDALNDEDEVKILIDGPLQAEEIKKFLASKGFNNIFPEDDEGILYLMASKKQEQKQITTPKAPEPPREHNAPVNTTTGIIISCETGKYKSIFFRKLLSSMLKAKTKPDVIALMNSAVKLAAYNSSTCDDLRRLESEGVQVLISESCADRLGITEAVGAGVVADMSEILDEIYSCGKVVSL